MVGRRGTRVASLRRLVHFRAFTTPVLCCCTLRHRFYELAGHYPETITVISYTLKEARFRTLHREAVRWPAEYFRFVGTPVPPEAKGAKVRKGGEQEAAARAAASRPWKTRGWWWWFETPNIPRPQPKPEGKVGTGGRK